MNNRLVERFSKLSKRPEEVVIGLSAAVLAATLAAGCMIDAALPGAPYSEGTPAVPVYAPEPLQWEQAEQYCADLTADGHEDYRLPSLSELHRVFNGRGVPNGGFEHGMLYWSSEQDGDGGVTAMSSTGNRPLPARKAEQFQVMCVR